MSTPAGLARPRWEHYVLLRGEQFRAFWSHHLSQRERALLFVLGRGFDPRMCLGVQAVMAAGGEGVRDVLALEYREGPRSPSLAHQNHVDQNWSTLQGATQGRGNLVMVQPDLDFPVRGLGD